MKNILLLKAISILFFLNSCSGSESSEIYQGHLEELISSDFSLKKDFNVASFNNLKITNGENEALVFRFHDQKKNSFEFSIFDIKQGQKKQEVSIPLDGPQSIKGSLGAYFLPKDEKEIFLLGRTGILGKYNEKGIKTFELDLNQIISNNFDFQRFSNNNGGFTINQKWIQLLYNPSFSEFDATNGNLITTFPLQNKNWILQINLETREVRYPEFPIPEGYNKFINDAYAINLSGCWNHKEGCFYVMWPYSEKIYKISEGIFKEEIFPESTSDHNFIPGEFKDWGQGFKVFSSPKEASSNIFLLFDHENDFFLKLIKTHESGDGNSKFERTKHYILSIHSSDWQPLGEYSFDFKGEIEVENWFLTSKGLYINKPEQANEDEYEFYRIDLSKVKK